MKILLRGSVSDRSSAGRATIGVARACMQAGATVHLAPGTAVEPPIPAKLAALYTQEPADDYDLLIAFDPAPPGSLPAKTKVLLGVSGLDKNSPWIPGSNSTGWDAVFYRDRETFKAIYESSPANFAVLPIHGGITAADFPWQERDWFGSLNFLVDTSEQQVAHRAFDQLATGVADHYGFPGLFQRTKPRLAAVDLKSLDSKQLLRVFKDFHVLLCTTGSPNVNYEFMATGGVVTALNAGVHAGWLSDNYSFRYTPVPGQDAAALAGVLCGMLNQPETTFRRAEQARQAAYSADWSRELERMFSNMEDYIDGGVPLRDEWLRLKPADVQDNSS